MFKITTDGTLAGTSLTTLVNFNSANGVGPYGALVLGRDGSFYGTTYQGGSGGYGTAFKLTTDGTPAGTSLTTLVNFNSANGADPYGALVQGGDGGFYGMTYQGGSNNIGTVFEIGVPTADSGAAATPENQPVGVSLTYFDPTGNQAGQTVTVGTPAHGTLTNQSVSYDPASGDGVVSATYTPNAGFRGTDSIPFTVTNGLGVSNTAVFTITVTDPALASLTAAPAPARVVGGSGNLTGTLTAEATANTVVTLTSSNPAALSVPASATVPAGSAIKTFTATSHPVTQTTVVTITATYNGVSKTATVTAPALAFLTAAPAAVKGGSANAVGTATLTGKTVSAATVTLTSSNPSVLSVPSSVTVAAGANAASFTATSYAVTKSTVVTITATYAGVSRPRTVTVTP